MACDAFRNVVSKVRSANYSLVLAHQALGDLRAVSDSFANAVLTNTATQIIFTVDEPGDADYFSRKSGSIVVHSLGESVNHSGQLWGAESTGESVQDYDQALVHPTCCCSCRSRKQSSIGVDSWQSWPTSLT
jgi:type IV secretory pathway TraG/TraD family ATPase VirD4